MRHAIIFEKFYAFPDIIRTKRSKRKPQKQVRQFFDRNDYIKVSEMRVVTEDGDNLGVLTKEQALSEARRREQDLVLINPNIEPPIARIISWSKFKYELSKKEKSKKGKSTEVKEMRFKANIDGGDLEHKLKKVREFLGKGNKVKMSVIYTSKTRPTREKMEETMKEILAQLGQSGESEGEIKREGRNIAVFVKPK